MRRIFIILILFAIGCRFYNLNWDQGFHLHPDERFLTMVANDARIPNSFSEYLDPTRSTLVPYNIKVDYFTYGMLPITLTKLVAHMVDMDDYDGLVLVGRRLSALFDVITILLVGLLGRLLQRRLQLAGPLPLMCAACYGLMVLPIQHAHFFVVDSFLTTFVTAAIASVAVWPTLVGAAVSGVLMGAAIGCKVSAVFFLPFIAWAYVLDRNKSTVLYLAALACAEIAIAIAWPNLIGPLYWGSLGFTVYATLLLLVAVSAYVMSRDKRALLDILAGASWFCITAYIGLRIADPKFFVSPYLLNPLVNPKFIANIHELARLSAKSDYPWPPGVQWLSKTPISFTMQNFFIFGVGPVLSVLMMFGLRFAWRIHQRAILGFCVIGACIVLWQGVQFLQTMRYLLPLYPLAACLAALGLVNCCFNARAALGLAALLVAWPFAFMHIYADDHTRVRASRWMYENLPDNTNIAVEHWDDSLPLGLPNQSKHFTFVETPVFEPDTSEKWQRLSEAWNKSEYLVLSSNRGWGSMMPLKFKYPRMSRWYEDLFAGRTQWRMVHHEASFPSLFGIELSTRSADEALSVYDHPEVYIFAKEAKAG